MKLIRILLIFLLCSPLAAQQKIIQPDRKVSNSFAIFVDQATFDACEDEILAYKESIEKYNGLAVFVLYANWESPEHVKYFIETYYNEQALEGAVFIGDIPIPMIRRAQHFSSAFKMDQERFPMWETSIPSDRFYDDLNLKFDFIGRDSVYTNYWYYNLSGESPQKINCTIYSGRIKQSQKGEEGYEQVRKYLKKAVREKESENILDKVVSYTGEGSFSNSLAAWKDETITLKEQMPQAFNTADGAKFYIFHTSPDVRTYVMNELRRPDVDLALFHGHGLPERQYLTGEEPSYYVDDHYENGKRRVRNYLRTIERRSTMTIDQAKEELLRQGVDSTWFEGVDDKEVIAADSLFELTQVFTLEDIKAIAPNPRVVIFDACYNGDFRNDSFVANSYIFADGSTIVGIGNSVNVLQDKSSSDLLGLLSYGYSVGEWYKNINIIESHIIGDPTFKFSSAKRLPRLKLHSKDTTYWKAVWQHRLPEDFRSLALYKLCELDYPGMSDFLLEVYRTSESYMQRLQCMHLLAYYNDTNYAQLLKEAVDDPYEYIRRKAVYYMGRVGRNDFIPYIVDLYLNDYLSERVAFNVTFTSHHLDGGLLKYYFEKAIEKSEFIFDKEAFLSQVNEFIERNERMLIETRRNIIDRSISPRNRMFYITVLRNNPFPQVVDDAIVALSDPTEDLSIRVSIAEALGWYVRSSRKESIIEACTKILDTEKDLDLLLTDELHKTINRLTVYMK